MKALTPSSLKWLRALGLVVVLVVLVVVMFHHEQERESTVHLVVEANRKVGWLLPIWSDVNVWMLARPGGFSPNDLGEPWGGAWLRDHAPWFRGARSLASPNDGLDRKMNFGRDGRALSSIHLYEKNGRSLYNFRKVRLQGVPLEAGKDEVAPWSTQVEELGFHPKLTRRFREKYRGSFSTTLFAASWHAEVMRSFLQDGDVASASPWLHELLDPASGALMPAGQVYALLGLLTGQLRAATGEPADEVRLEPTGDDRGHSQVAVIRATPAMPHGNPSLEALASEDRGTVRILIVRHQADPVPDGDPKQEELALKLDLTVHGLPGGQFQLRFTSIGAPGGSRWTGTETSPLNWISGCRQSRGGWIALARGFPVPGNAVLLFEVIPDAACTG